MQFLWQTRKKNLVKRSRPGTTSIMFGWETGACLQTCQVVRLPCPLSISQYEVGNGSHCLGPEELLTAHLGDSVPLYHRQSSATWSMSNDLQHGL